MPYIAPETIIEARNIDLLTYLKNFEPDELVKVSANIYCTRTHDSLKISNGKWYWFSEGIGGYNALDYLVKVRGISFKEAIEKIMGLGSVCPVQEIKPSKPPPPKKLVLPQKSNSSNVVTQYLFDRGIDYEIITDCIDKGLIYESLQYHNVVFVGQNECGEVKYAAYRATNKSRIMGNAKGSDRRYSFQISGIDKSDVHIFESAIDALSYATLCKLECQDWRALNLISLGGVAVSKGNQENNKLPGVLENYLQNNSQTSPYFTS